MRKNVLVIYNPKAGTEKAKTFLSKLLVHLTKNNARPVVFPITKQYGSEEIIADEGESADCVVVCGGDGTLNHAVNGLMKLDKRPLLAYVPSGSTNDFAVSMGISEDFRKTCKSIDKGEPFYYDIGMFNGKYFNYVAAFGAFTDVSYDTPQKLKNALGHTAYVLNGIVNLPINKYYHAKITADGNVFEGNYIYGSVSNSTSIGGIKAAEIPGFEPDDGYMELTLVKMPSDIMELGYVLNHFIAQNFDNEYIKITKAKSIKIEFDEEVDWTLDGEYGGRVARADIVVLNKEIGLIR